MTYRKGEMVWVSKEADRSYPEKAGQVLRSDEEKGEFEIKIQPGWDNTPDSLKITKGDGYHLAIMMMPPAGVDDMMTLSDLHVGALLHNLKVRFNNQIIYTYIGQILVAVNPFDYSLGLTEMPFKKKYCGCNFSEMPPHVFAIANQAWENMMRDRHHQSCIVSGESGAGKSESTKHVLQFLAYRSFVVGGKETEVANQVVDTSLILEAFGNACTTRNNNSSRFGKFVEVQFDDKGVIIGADVKQYLLEKSRVVTAGAKERGYHIFYDIFHHDAASVAEWGLTKKEAYRYTYEGGIVVAPGIEDDKEHKELCKCMKALNFNEALQKDVFTVMAAILHLGQIQYVKKPGSKDDAAEIKDPAPLKQVCKLMGMDEEKLAFALVSKQIITKEAVITKPLTVRQAAENTDAFAKGIYAPTFEWIVRFINQTTARDSCAQWIGCLDIFGFEHFKVPRPDGSDYANNSFEQFCINFANEMLQGFFNTYIFEQEADIYRSEGIDVDKIEFDDNKACLQLIEEQMKMLDEESLSNREGISNEGFLAKMHAKWDTTPGKCKDMSEKDKDKKPCGGFQKKEEHRKKPEQYYGKLKACKAETDKTDFYISHYAGEIQYSVCRRNKNDPKQDPESIGFVEKNRDQMVALFIPILQECKIGFIQEIFRSDQSSAKTVASVFRSSLKALVTRLNMTDPWFIRCVKPNISKVKIKFENDMVLAQLRAAGMLETIAVRNAGFPQRLTPEVFLDRYDLVGQLVENCNKGDPPMEQCAAICDWVFERPNHKITHPPWAAGKTKVFMKESMARALEAELSVAKKEVDRRKAVFVKHLVAISRMYLAYSDMTRLKEQYAINKKRLDRKRELMAQGMSAADADRQILKEEEEARLAAIEAERVAAVGDLETAAPKSGEGVTEQMALLDDIGVKTHEDSQREDVKNRRKALQDAQRNVEDTMRALKGDGWRDKDKIAAAREAVQKLQSLNDTEKSEGPKAKARMEEYIKKEAEMKAEAERKAREEREERERKEREERERLEREERERREEEERRQRLEREEKERQELESKLRAERAEYERQLQRERAELERKENNERLERERMQRQADEKIRQAEARLKAEKMAAVKAEKDRIQMQLNKAKKEHQDLENERQRLLAQRREKEKQAKRESDLAAVEAQQKRYIAERKEKVARKQAALKAKIQEDREFAKTRVLDGTKVLWKGRRATIRYCGRLPIPNSDDTWLGLEMEKPLPNKLGNDGSCLGVQFFRCRPDHGLFVRDEKVQIVHGDAAKKPGAHVIVRGKRGVIRYVGEVYMQEGTWVGIELEEEGAGKNDGTVRGHRYFTCPPRTGIFTTLDSVDIVSNWTPEYLHEKLMEYCIENGLVTDEDMKEIVSMANRTQAEVERAKNTARK